MSASRAPALAATVAGMVLSVLALDCQLARGALGPSFGRPVTVSSAAVPGASAPPALAIDAAGSSVIAWRGRAGILIRRVGPGGSLGPVQSLGAGSSPAVSIAADGSAAAMWEGSPRGEPGRRLLLASTAPPGRPFGAPQRLLLTSSDVPSWSVVATDERVVAMWGQDVAGQQATGSPIRYALAPGAARFGAPQTLAPAYYANLGGVGVDGAGDVVAGFQTPAVLGSNAGNAQVAAAVLPVGAQTFDPPQVLSAASEQAITYSEGVGASVASGPGGVAVGFSVQGTLPWLLQVSTLGSGQSFGAPLTIAEVPNPPPGIATYSGPVAALPSTGGLVAAWTVGRDRSAQDASPASGALDVVEQQPSGALSAPEQLSQPRTLSQDPFAAATTDTAIVAWGEGRFNSQRLVYSVRAAGGRFGLPQTLGTGGLRGAALSGSGAHAAVAWIAGHRLLMAELTG